jgi:PAS domain S-box-containing protein
VNLDPGLAAGAAAAAGDAIITVDRGGTIMSWNPAAERLLGSAPEDAIGQTLALIVPAEHRPRHVAAFHTAMDGGHPVNDGAVARVEASTASGARLVPGMSLGLLPGEDVKPAGAVAVLRLSSEAVVPFVPASRDS